MSLPGKLCIGILEEDNPLKSYFRFKPLLIEEGGNYVPYVDTGAYPEEGCIRIVPDKNESYHFKTRMRRMGLFCVVDLRGHPEANDKIRANKNYHEGGPEQNAYIIYSDVVHEPVADTIFEIVPEGKPQLIRPAPRTAQVLQRGEALMPRRYSWESVSGAEGQARLIDTERDCDLEKAQVFELPIFKGETVNFAILPMPQVEATAERAGGEKPAAEEKPAAKQEAEPTGKQPEPEAKKAQPEPAEKPESESRKTEEAAPKAEVKAKAEAGHKGEAKAEAKGEAKAEAASKPEKKAEPKPEAPAQPAEEKPWIHHDQSVMPAPVDPKLPPYQRALAAQRGLNPRKGRSLQELIDDKWQLSRMNQLGQPVADLATGMPLASPVESAVSAVRSVWNQPQLRLDLLDSLCGLEEFGATLKECREDVRAKDIERHLEDLEARRIALLDELDHLNLRNAQVRGQLKQELMRDADAEVAEAGRRAEAARAERDKYERLADEARSAAQDARKAVEALTGEELERRLRDFALDGHMLERIRQIRGEAEAIPDAPQAERLTAQALMARIERRFEAEGIALERFDAANLTACLISGRTLTLSGPVGSGKTATARLLGEALGLEDRFAAFAPGTESLAGSRRVKALKAKPGLPAMLLLDDANLTPAADPLRGLGEGLPEGWRLCLTVQDTHSGCPLNAAALDKGFLVRLSGRSDAPWRPPVARATEPEAMAFPDAECDLPEGGLPAACEERMERLRKALNGLGAPISRRALDESWRYCAAMLALLGEEADPVRVLDHAVAQRLLPAVMAGAPVAALVALPRALEGLPASLSLLSQPVPVLV